MIRQDCQHISDVYEEHACSSTGILVLCLWYLAIAMEKSFHSSCQKTSILMEYYRSLCNLGLVYLNESVSDTENGLYGESDFHILYRSIPLFRRSYTTIKVAEVRILFSRIMV